MIPDINKRIRGYGRHFVLLDVSDLLPRHNNFPYATSVVKPSGVRAIPSHWHFKKIKGRKVVKIYCHQTAGSVHHEGFDGLLRTYAFMIRDPAYTEEGNWLGTGRGWPGGSYTYYLPYKPMFIEGRAVIFKCWSEDWVTWHSKDNYESVAIVCQGYFKSRHIKSFKPRKGCPQGKPSSAQMLALRSFIEEYAIGELGIEPENVKGHSESPHPKLACPGDDIEKLYMSIRFGDSVELTDRDYINFPHIDDLPALNTWEERQAALLLLGHYLGSYGKKDNGVDGDPGYITRMAIETEESNLGIKVDGYWDDTFDYHVKVQLVARCYEQEDIDELIP